MTTQDNMLSMDSLERKLKGLPARTIDPALAATAQSLAEMFAAGARFSHNVGGGMSARASANGWSGTMLAENIAYGSETVEGAGQRELGPAQAFHEVAPAQPPGFPQGGEHGVEAGEAAGYGLGEDGIAAQDPDNSAHSTCLSAPVPLRGTCGYLNRLPK
jgi:hypothetical protein